MAPVIVFGPTGNIGSVAARTAAEQGSKVFLAMRNTDKAIPGLDSETEKSGGFERVQADLMQPDTIAAAVKKSGAKRAFFYLAHGNQDGMKGVIQALKDAGIEFVVFLSSFTVKPTGIEALRAVPSDDLIPYIHAVVEANLEEIYGEGNFVAVRPGAFVTNLLRHAESIKTGKVDLFGGEFVQDNTHPGDMGRVSGVLLANGTKKGERYVHVYGSEQLSVHDSIKKIASLLGKDVQIKALNPEEGLQSYLKAGLPKMFAEYMVRIQSKGIPHGFPEYENGVANVKLYTGREPEKLEAWVEENKALLT